jgi:Tfp pilus assembly pilus retraction ATPase PilT
MKEMTNQDINDLNNAVDEARKNDKDFDLSALIQTWEEKGFYSYDVTIKTMLRLGDLQQEERKQNQ